LVSLTEEFWLMYLKNSNLSFIWSECINLSARALSANILKSAVGSLRSFYLKPALALSIYCWKLLKNAFIKSNSASICSMNVDRFSNLSTTFFSSVYIASSSLDCIGGGWPTKSLKILRSILTHKKPSRFYRE
jgi:hypothetical protein